MGLLSREETSKKIESDPKLRDDLRQLAKENPAGVDIPAVTQRAHALDVGISFREALSNPVPIPK